VVAERYVVPLSALDPYHCCGSSSRLCDDVEEESWLDDILDNELFLYSYRSEGDGDSCTLYSARLSSRSIPMTIREGIFDEDEQQQQPDDMAMSARDDFFLDPLDNHQTCSLFDPYHLLQLQLQDKQGNNNNYNNNENNNNNRHQLSQFKNLVQRLRLTPRSPCQNPQAGKRAKAFSPRLAE
jgi:hypothetical protein